MSRLRPRHRRGLTLTRPKDRSPGPLTLDGTGRIFESAMPVKRREE